MGIQESTDLYERWVGAEKPADILAGGYEALRSQVGSLYDSSEEWQQDGEPEDVVEELWGYCLVSLAAASTINGVQVKSCRVYTESDYWRWQIVDANGRGYVDGGNYRTSRAAARGLIDALEAA